MFFTSFAYAQNFDAYRLYVKGMLEQRHGKLKDAKKDYEQSIKADPDAFAIYKDLMFLYWQLGDKDEALQAAEKLNDMDGGNANTTAFLGNFYLIANSTENAKKYWDKTLEIDPANEMALSSLASQYANNNDFALSEKYWKFFLEQDPESIFGYIQLGLVQERQNENESALKTYDDLIKIKPEIGEAYIAKARVYENAKQLNLAAAEYEKVAKLFPHNPFVLIYLGRCYFLMNDLDKAKAALLEAKEVAPDDMNVSYWLGAVYERLGLIDDAIAEFESINKRQTHLIVLAKLGYFYTAKRDLKQSEKYFLKALKLEPNNDELIFYLGLNYMEQQKFDKAFEYFTKLTEVNPGFAQGHFFLGTIYEKKDDIENAQVHFLKALEIEPEFAQASNALAYMYVKNNIHLDKAKEILENLVAKYPQNPAILDSLGWLYYKIALMAPFAQRTMRLEQAQRVLLAGVNLSMDPIAYEHLGDAYVALNNNADAWVVYMLAYEITGTAEIKKKIEQAQEKLTDKELFSKMLFISESHYLKLNSLRAGYKAKAISGVFSKKAYFAFNYVKGDPVLLEFPAEFLFSDAKIYIKDGNIVFAPKALQKEIGTQISDLIKVAAKLFDKNFYRTFDNATIEKNGDEIVYTSPEVVLVLSLKDSLIKKIIVGDISIEILANKKFFSSELPSRIKVMSTKMKFTVVLETDEFRLATQHIVIPQN
jgi:tetratricopeptide (TPR) repeat protein